MHQLIMNWSICMKLGSDVCLRCPFSPQTGYFKTVSACKMSMPLNLIVSTMIERAALLVTAVGETLFECLNRITQA